MQIKREKQHKTEKKNRHIETETKRMVSREKWLGEGVKNGKRNYIQ